MSASVQGCVAAELARGGYQNVHDLLAQACAKHPQRLAFSCGDDCLSYAELGSRADAFARYLRYHAGLQPGDRLALQLPNSLQYPIATFGALNTMYSSVWSDPWRTRSAPGLARVTATTKLAPRVYQCCEPSVSC